MSTANFNLITYWTVNSPLDAVWRAMTRPEEWPTWWPAVIAVDVLEPGDADGIGAYRRMTWRTALPYRLSFNMRTIRIDRHSQIEGVADGNLEGRGRWQFTAEGDRTHLRYDWQVAVTKRWMRALSPLLRPAFAWNHGVVMGWGKSGLQRYLTLDAPAANRFAHHWQNTNRAGRHYE